jgi:hypothetical protein
LDSGCWKIESTGLWFEPPNGSRIELGRRRTLRRLLVRLAERRVRRVRSPVTITELIDVGWPNERILRSAALNRLRVALHALRRLGLGDLLLTHADGYLLNPRSGVELVPAEA